MGNRKTGNCQYVTGSTRANDEPGTAKGNMKAVLQMTKCGVETNNLMFDVMSDSMVFVCLYHAERSKPLKEQRW